MKFPKYLKCKMIIKKLFKIQPCENSTTQKLIDDYKIISYKIINFNV